MKAIIGNGSAKPGRASIATLAAVLLAGCSSTGGGKSMLPTQPTVRSTSDTAPTDLQLLCASTAGQQLGTENVLPVSSMRSGPNAYQVNLTYGGGQAICFIGDDGIVQSISQV